MTTPLTPGLLFTDLPSRRLKVRSRVRTVLSTHNPLTLPVDDPPLGRSPCPPRSKGKGSLVPFMDLGVDLFQEGEVRWSSTVVPTRQCTTEDPKDPSRRPGQDPSPGTWERRLRRYVSGQVPRGSGCGGFGRPLELTRRPCRSDSTTQPPFYTIPPVVVVKRP